MLKFFSKKEYQTIADLFELGKIRDMRAFRQGYQTPKVVVSTGRGMYVIAKHTLSAKRTIVADMKIVPRIALLHEITFLNTLGNLPVPKYCISRNKKYLEDFGGYMVSVYRYLRGTHPKMITNKMAQELGAFVGAFHALGTNHKKPLKGRRKFYDLTPAVLLMMNRIARRQKNPKLKNVVEEVKRGVERYQPPRGLPRGPIHVDIKPDNELFVGNKLNGIIDFGNMYVGPFIFDVAKTIMWNCVKKERVDGRLTEAFLAGYESFRKLSTAERSYLPRAILFAIYSHLWVDLYHVPIRYVPERYTLFLVKTFLPVARTFDVAKFIKVGGQNPSRLYS